MCVQFLSVVKLVFFWSIHCIYVVQRGCRQISETAMQLIYCKCRCVSFWIYIFLNSFSKVKTKVDLLFIIYVDACWNISDALSAAWNWFFNLNLKHFNIHSEICISLWWDKNHQWFFCPFIFLLLYPGLLFTSIVVPHLSDLFWHLWGICLVPQNRNNVNYNFC